MNALPLLPRRHPGGNSFSNRALPPPRTTSSGIRAAIDYLEAAAPLYEELGDDEGTCDVHMRLALYLSTYVGVMDVRRAMLHYKKAEAFLKTHP